MIRRTLLALLAFGLLSSIAFAGGGRNYLTMYSDYSRASRWHNANTQWHGPYAHPFWRQPMALIAPPNANMQTSYDWGVGRTRMVPGYHQFTRPYVPPGGGGGGSMAPNWPSSTTHQGVYWVRGPW
ncbi:MAG: hypothetical protein AAF497_06745 [Planctomycetota bacterium]